MLTAQQIALDLTVRLFQKWLETKKDPATQFKYFVKYINNPQSCYEVLGYSTGAGTSKETTLVIYQDTSTKQLYHRTFDDFCQKMIPF